MSSILLQYLKNPKVGPNWHAKRGDPYGFFNIHCCKTSNKLRGTLWREFFPEKVSHCRFCQHAICRKTSKTLKGSQNINPFGEKFFSRKKSHNAEKTERGPFSLARYCMLRGKRGKTFLVKFAEPNDSISDHETS